MDVMGAKRMRMGGGQILRDSIDVNQNVATMSSMVPRSSFDRLMSGVGAGGSIVKGPATLAGFSIEEGELGAAECRPLPRDDKVLFISSCPLTLNLSVAAPTSVKDRIRVAEKVAYICVAASHMDYESEAAPYGIAYYVGGSTSVKHVNTMHVDPMTSLTFDVPTTEAKTTPGKSRFLTYSLDKFSTATRATDKYYEALQYVSTPARALFLGAAYLNELFPGAIPAVAAPPPLPVVVPAAGAAGAAAPPAPVVPAAPAAPVDTVEEILNNVPLGIVPLVAAACLRYLDDCGRVGTAAMKRHVRFEWTAAQFAYRRHHLGTSRNGCEEEERHHVAIGF